MGTTGGGALLVPGLAIRAGQVLAGRYRVEELLGAGSGGMVVAARQVHLREPVTLKILAAFNEAQEDLLERRLEKARAAARLRGEHVARVKDIGVTEHGLPYVASERLEGSTLDAELEARGGRLPVAEAVRWVLEACEGVAEAHAIGLVHGDLKPHNLFLARTREGGTILKVLDFGMASPIEAADASASAWFGSPAYLAPEQIREPHRVDARADVWALGVLLFELIAGSLPFAADTVSGVLVSVVFDAPPLLTDAPYDLARVVHRCLEKDPDARPASVEELAEALAPFVENGARLSERVRAALASPPPVATGNAALDAGASGSVPPVSVSVEPPESHAALPLVTRRSPRDEPTRPSQRVRAQRARGCATALAVVCGIAAVSVASTLAMRAPAAPGARAARTYEAEPTPLAPRRAPSPPEAAATPKDLPTEARPAPAKPRPRARPRKRTPRKAVTARPAVKLPAGIPSTREPVPSSPRARGAAKTPPSDESYFRHLFDAPK